MFNVHDKQTLAPVMVNVGLIFNRFHQQKRKIFELLCFDLVTRLNVKLD